MRRSLTAAVFAALLIGADAPDVRKTSPEGTWKFVSLEYNGKMVLEKWREGSVIVIEGVRFKSRRVASTNWWGGLCHWDSTTFPHEIEWTPDAQRLKSYSGIYEIAGDRLKICCVHHGKVRPARFESLPGTGHALYVFARADP